MHLPPCNSLDSACSVDNTIRLRTVERELRAMSGFEQVLKRLVEDRQYRDAVVSDPARITQDYKALDPRELLLLMQIWHASGDPRAANIITMCHCCCGSEERQ
jgi:hypothetical protein